MDISPDTIIGIGAFACSIGAVAVMHGWRKLHAQQEMQEQLHMEAVQDLQRKNEHLRGEVGKANIAATDAKTELAKWRLYGTGVPSDGPESGANPEGGGAGRGASATPDPAMAGRESRRGVLLRSSGKSGKRRRRARTTSPRPPTPELAEEEDADVAVESTVKQLEADVVEQATETKQQQ